MCDLATAWRRRGGAVEMHGGLMQYDAGACVCATLPQGRAHAPLPPQVIEQYLSSRTWTAGMLTDLGGALLMIVAFANAPVRGWHMLWGSVENYKDGDGTETGAAARRRRPPWMRNGAAGAKRVKA